MEKTNNQLSGVCEADASDLVKPRLADGLTYVPYQKCPKCDGQGNVQKPPYVPGDVHEWTSTSLTHVCDVCNGQKIIPMYALPIMPNFILSETCVHLGDSKCGNQNVCRFCSQTGS